MGQRSAQITDSHPNTRSGPRPNIALSDDEYGTVARPIRILIADDSDAWRVETADILQERPELRIISEADNGLDAVNKAAELRPDLVLLDIHMPDLDGIEAARKIRLNSPNSHIVFVTQIDDSDILTAALDAGAEEYVLKINAGSQLVNAIFGCFHHVT
jgi:DNA-binding NarL/FixJ family response regulator